MAVRLTSVLAIFPKVPLSPGYGSTEAGNITDANGKFYFFVNWKIEDVTELNYLVADKPYPRGQLLVKSTGAISGYFHDEEANQNNFDKDGYFKTVCSTLCSSVVLLPSLLFLLVGPRATANQTPLSLII